MTTSFEERLARLEGSQLSRPQSNAFQTGPIAQAEPPWALFYIKGLFFGALTIGALLFFAYIDGRDAMLSDIVSMIGWIGIGGIVAVMALPFAGQLRAHDRKRRAAGSAEERKQIDKAEQRRAMRFAVPWFFAIPWWILLPLAAFFGAMTISLYQSEISDQKLGAILAEQPAPAATDLSSFDKERDIHPLDEIHVHGWINADYNYRLVETTDAGREKDMRHMYVFFGKADDANTKTARAAILLKEREKDQFLDQLSGMVTDVMPSGDPVFAINGFKGSTDGFIIQMKDAFEREGLVRSDDFVIIEPFLAGRATALINEAKPTAALIIGTLITVLLTWSGLHKLRNRRRAKQARRAARDWRYA